MPMAWSKACAWRPISYVAVIRLAAMTLIPAAPLLLTMVPFNELVLKLFSIAL